MATIEESAIQVLKDAKRPLHYVEIAKKIFEEGLTEINSKTPELSVHVIITNSIKNKGILSPFSKTDEPGFFMINPYFNLEKYRELGESMSLVKKGHEFEERMKGLLKRLEFDKVDGGNNFVIGGHQVDIAAIFEKNVIVFECKMSQEVKRKSLRKVINELKGKINSISEGFKSTDYWNKANFFKFVLLVNRNIQIRDEDIQEACKSPRIYLMKEEALEYYNELYSFLKPYAKYNLLGELGIKPLHSEPKKVLAFRTKYSPGIDMYSFVINPKELIKFAYVARRERGQEKFYQRIINKDRLDKIKEYIKSGGRFPNNIIISFNEENERYVRFAPLENTKNKKFLGSGEIGFLEFPQDYRSCWVIDGQHRLFAHIDLDLDLETEILVSAFRGVDLNQQGAMFLDINKNQKPVPTDLVWDLVGELSPNTQDGRISQAVRLLNFKDYDGPLYHKIYFPSLGLRKKFKDSLKVGGFCIAIKRSGFARKDGNTKSGTKNLFYDEYAPKHSQKIRKGISSYYKVVKEIFKEDWEKGNKGFVLDDGGAGVMIRLLEKIMGFAIYTSNDLDENLYKKILISSKKYLNKYISSETNLKKLKKLYFASESGRDSLLKEICLFVRNDLNELRFGGEIESEDLEDDLKNLERKISYFIYKILSNEDVNWVKTLLPQDISKKIRSKVNEDYDSAHKYFTIDEEIRTIKKEDNFPFFKDIFVNSNGGFHNENLFFGAFEHLRDVRNKLIHNRPEEVTKDDEKTVRDTIQKIENCIGFDPEENE